MTPGEIVIKLTPPEPDPPGVYRCFACGGLGTDPNTGSVMISTTEIRVTPGLPCGLCGGARKVRVTPYRESDRDERRTD